MLADESACCQIRFTDRGQRELLEVLKLNAVPVGLVPYHGDVFPPSQRHTWQQVLVRDVSVLKPNIEPTCESMSS